MNATQIRGMHTKSQDCKLSRAAPMSGGVGRGYNQYVISNSNGGNNLTMLVAKAGRLGCRRPCALMVLSN